MTEINVLIPTILIIINEVLKKYFSLADRFCVLVNLFGGIFLYCLLLSPTPTDLRSWTMAILTGLLMGASAGGLYDIGKTTIQTKFFREEK